MTSSTSVSTSRQGIHDLYIFNNYTCVYYLCQYHVRFPIGICILDDYMLLSMMEKCLGFLSRLRHFLPRGCEFYTSRLHQKFAALLIIQEQLHDGMTMLFAIFTSWKNYSGLCIGFQLRKHGRSLRTVHEMMNNFQRSIHHDVFMQEISC